MNAGLIVGYVTQPNGMPIGDAEIWITAIKDTQANAVDENAARRPAAKTDSRGYFQLPFVCFGGNVAEIFCTDGRLNMVVNSPSGAPENSAALSSKNFQVTGYLVKDAAEAKA